MHLPRLLCLVGAGLFVLPALCSTATADAAQTIACTPANPAFGSVELVCPIAPAAQAQWLRFEAVFQGVHDDSSAGLAAKVDGQALACGEGSRPRLQGDGEGSALSCALPVPAARAARELRLQLVWHHADPTGYTLRREAAR